MDNFCISTFLFVFTIQKLLCKYYINTLLLRIITLFQVNALNTRLFTKYQIKKGKALGRVILHCARFIVRFLICQHIFEIKNVCRRIRGCSCTFAHTRRSTLNKTGFVEQIPSGFVACQVLHDKYPLYEIYSPFCR